MIRVVLDTTVIVSAVVSPNGPNARLFDLILNKEIRPYVTEAVLDEYVKVFDYEHLKHLSKAKVARLRGTINRLAVIVGNIQRAAVDAHQTPSSIPCALRRGHRDRLD